MPNGDTAGIHLNSADTDQWIWHLVHLLFEFLLKFLLKAQGRKSQQTLQHNVLLVFVKCTSAVCLSIMVSHSRLGCGVGVGEGGGWLFTNKVFVQAGHYCTLLSKPQSQECSRKEEWGPGRGKTKLAYISAQANKVFDADTRDHSKFPQKA